MLSRTVSDPRSSATNDSLPTSLVDVSAPARPDDVEATVPIGLFLQYEAQNMRLREALKPFADFIEGTYPDWADDRRIATLDCDMSKLTLGLFRRARAALVPGS